MSGAISNGFGVMPTLMRNIDRLTAQSSTLTAELSSGVVASTVAGLGDQTYQAVSLEPQISAVNAWQANLSETQTKLSVTQTALSSISAIATSLQTSLASLSGLGSSSDIAAASASAKQQLTELTSLLNTKSGNSYVFAGAASDQPPIAGGDLASSSAVASITAAVASVDTAGATATEAAALSSAAPANIFSIPGDTAPQVQIGQNQTMASGIVAAQGGVSSGSSTGSPIADLICALATVAGLSSAGSSTSANFQALVSNTLSQAQAAGQGIDGLTATVGLLQNNATAQSSALSDVQGAMQSQLDTLKNADPATISVQQTAVQNQLTASYTLIADMKTLTLAQYI